MGPDWLLHHLQLLALLWLCVLLLWVWLRGRDGTSPTPFPPVKAITKRSKELPPLAGLLHTPRCAACEQAATSRPQAPCAPLPLLPGTRGHRRTVETRHPCCPDDACSYYGWVGRSNIRANGHPDGTP